MGTLTIEFFHDIICSFCYPMSFRMRKLQAMFPEITVIHRSFALVEHESDFVQMFGSREQAKNEILTHWENANKNDELHRFNIEGMKKQSFAFPMSLKPLLACKAADFVGNKDAYWDIFDSLQTAFFNKNRNIGADEVIFDIVMNSDVDFEKWKVLFSSEKVRLAVENDFKIAKAYGIRSVPTIVLNKQEFINGAVPLNELARVVEKMGFYRRDYV